MSDQSDSLGSECRTERDIEQALQEHLLLRCLRDKSWPTADGRCIPVRQMDAQHIRNILNMLKNETDSGGEFSELFSPMLKIELRRRLLEDFGKEETV